MIRLGIQFWSDCLPPALWSPACRQARAAPSLSCGVERGEPYVVPVQVDELNDVWDPGTKLAERSAFLKARGARDEAGAPSRCGRAWGVKPGRCHDRKRAARTLCNPLGFVPRLYSGSSRDVLVSDGDHKSDLLR